VKEKIEMKTSPTPTWGNGIVRFYLLFLRKLRIIDQGRSPGSFDFLQAFSVSAKPMARVAKAFPKYLLGNQTYSCGDSSGIAPDSLLIPRTETLGMETKIDVNKVQFSCDNKGNGCVFF
jgi:hypothetical protein